MITPWALQTEVPTHRISFTLCFYLKLVTLNTLWTPLNNLFYPFTTLSPKACKGNDLSFFPLPLVLQWSSSERGVSGRVPPRTLIILNVLLSLFVVQPGTSPSQSTFVHGFVFEPLSCTWLVVAPSLKALIFQEYWGSSLKVAFFTEIQSGPCAGERTSSHVGMTALTLVKNSSRGYLCSSSTLVSQL